MKKDVKIENQNTILKSIFFKNRICLSEQNDVNKFIERLSEILYKLSYSCVWDGKLAIGGAYHKNQYNSIKKGFLHKKSEVLCLKNVKICDFGEIIKQNLCNYGIYFYTKKGKEFIKIFCGNGFLIEKTIQNYIEKHFKEKLIKG